MLLEKSIRFWLFTEIKIGQRLKLTINLLLQNRQNFVKKALQGIVTCQLSLTGVDRVFFSLRKDCQLKVIVGYGEINNPTIDSLIFI
jgi:hypothetical protein